MTRLGQLARGWAFALALAAALTSGGCQATDQAKPLETPSAPVSEAWTQLPEGPLSPRREVAGGWLGQRFVVAGGWSDQPCPASAGCLPPQQSPLRDGASYDPATGDWTRIADAPVPVTGWHTVVLDDRLYVLTSDVHRADSPVSFLRYDPARDAWTSLPLPERHDSVRLIAGDRTVFVLAEYGKQRPIDVFDPRAQSWRRLPIDPLGRSSSRAAVWLEDGLLLTSSRQKAKSDQGNDTLELATLDRTLNRWTVLPELSISGGYPIAVAGTVVYPFFNVTGERVDDDDQLYPNGAVLNTDGSWRMLPRPPRGRGLVADHLNVGSRTLVGGHLVDPRTGRWTTIPDPRWGQRNGQTFLSSSDTIFVWGGTKTPDDGRETNVNDGFLLRP